MADPLDGTSKTYHASSKSESEPLLDGNPGSTLSGNQHYVKTLESQVTPSRFDPSQQVHSSYHGGKPLRGTKPSVDSGVVGVRVKASAEALEEIREALDAQIATLSGRGRPRLDRQQLLHNYLTLRVWLITSIAVGARFATHPLINPDALLPGDLFLIADKRSDRRESDSVDWVAEIERDRPGYLWSKIPPATRVIAMPEHVADQIREYGKYYKALLGSECPKQSRWAPFFYVPVAGSGETMEVQPVWADQILPKYRRFKEVGQWSRGSRDRPAWFTLFEEISGVVLGEDRNPRLFNRWRHFLRQQLIGIMPGELIDAHLGHAQTGQDPWVYGAALDPVESWERMRGAISKIVPPEKWPVRTMGGLSKEHPLRLPAPPNSPSLMQTPPHGESDLHDVFHPEGFVAADQVNEVEQRHLRLTGEINWSDVTPFNDAHILISGVLWSALLDRNQWARWLTAVAREVSCKSGAKIDWIELGWEAQGVAQTRVVYHDSLTARLLQLWTPSKTVYSEEDIAEAWTRWAKDFARPCSLEKLIVAFERRARLRLPAILVDFANGSTLSPSTSPPLWRSTSDYKNLTHDSGYFGSPLDLAYQHAVYDSFGFNLPKEKKQLWSVLHNTRENIRSISQRSMTITRNKNAQIRIFRKALSEEYRKNDILDVFAANLYEKRMSDLFALTLDEITRNPKISENKELRCKAKRVRDPKVVAKLTQCYAILGESWWRANDLKKVGLCQIFVLKFLKSVNVSEENSLSDIEGHVDIYFEGPYFQDGAQRYSIDKEEVAFARDLLCSALIRIKKARTSFKGEAYQYEQQAGAGRSRNSAEQNYNRSRRLISAPEYYAALHSLGNWERWLARDGEKGAQATEAKRRSDVTRICMALMYRAGLRPHELASLCISDLTFYRRTSGGPIERAELVISANGFHRRKTRLSGRRLPLDALLEPVELEFLYEFTLMRRTEVGGFGKEDLLLSLGNCDIGIQNWGQPLSSNWLLEPVAASLLEATRQLKKRRPSGAFERNGDVSLICYHLRHTAATTLLATLLLPEDAGGLPSGPQACLVPDLISLERKRRLVPRLLGKGSAGRPAAHAVARLLGHYDLSTLRSTYAHLMDWSLGCSIRRRAIQPPLTAKAIQRLATRSTWREEDWNGDTVRKATQRFHKSIAINPGNAPVESVVLALKEYRLNRRGKPVDGLDRQDRFVGYLDCGLDRGGAVSGGDNCTPDFRVHSRPERWQVVDLVIRAHKSGWDEDTIERNFGIPRDDAHALIKKWVQIMGMTTWEGKFQEHTKTLQPTFGDIADPDWNNLSSISLCDLAENPLAESFRRLCQAMWANGDRHGHLSLRRRQLMTQAFRILLTRRNPYTGLYNARLKERRKSSYRWISAFVKNVISNKLEDFVEYKRIRYKIYFKIKRNKEFNFEKYPMKGRGIIGLRRSACYAIILYVIDNYDDMNLFMHPNVLTWHGLKKIENTLKPASDGCLNKVRVGSEWYLDRLFKNLEYGFFRPEQNYWSSVYVGLLDRDADEHCSSGGYLFRIVSVTGYTITGCCSEISDTSEDKRYELAGATIPSLREGRALKRLIIMPDGEAHYTRSGGCDDLILQFSDQGSLSPFMQALLEERGRYDKDRVRWIIGTEHADYVEAVLFSRATSIHVKRSSDRRE